MIMKGQKISDRYQIIKTIGEGGMANVYLAYDTILDRKVAVKVLRGDLANDEKFVRRFQREALSASSLTHPNIVEVYDVGEDNGLYYIVMEYIEGRHLKQLLKKRGKLTLNEVIDIMLQITDGMSCAHDSYIIHRDIKPQNIMILENGMVKITDFGIAMAMNSTQLTQTNSVMGSVHYLPPEQASGKGSTIQSDVYSMGILMYELLSGALPYSGDNAVEIALKHLKEPLPSIRIYLPDIPQSVENVILKSTAKNPKNRYIDARAMHEDLLTVLDEDRLHEEKYKYPYEDGNLDDTKILKKISEKNDNDEEVIAKKITSNDLKKQNKTLIVLAAIFTGLILVTTVCIFLLPKVFSKPNVVVPDVSGLSVAEADKKLIKAGFTIEAKIRTESSSKIKKNKITRTSPAAGRTVKKGTEITLYKSLGNTKMILKDYTNTNYIIAKQELEALKINVVIEKIDVDNPSNYTDGNVIKQSPKSKTTLKEGDVVKLYIPNVESVYPDFVKEGWTEEKVRSFASQYGLSLSVEKKESDYYENGVVMAQSREAGTKIVSGASLKVTIAIPKETMTEEGNTNNEESDTLE